MSWKHWEHAADEGPEEFTWKAMKFIALFLILGSLLFGGVWVILRPFRTASGVMDRTMNADNVLYNYEWFKRQTEAVAAIDEKIEQQRASVDSYTNDLGPRTDWDRMDKEEHARLNSILIGLQQQRADMVAEYNARARMANRRIFMGGDVPSQLQ